MVYLDTVHCLEGIYLYLDRTLKIEGNVKGVKEENLNDSIESH